MGYIKVGIVYHRIKNNFTEKEEMTEKKSDCRNKISLFKIKKTANKEIFYLFGLLPVWYRPVIFSDDNTFVVWEPCAVSHGEVVPGFVQYLLDLGYTVSVVCHPRHRKDGLFSRLQHEKLFLNNISRKQAKKYFKNADLSALKGIVVTTMGKLCSDSNITEARRAFSDSISRDKLFFVEHDAKNAIDENRWDKNIITLRKLNYKDAASVVVNPHSFGKIELTPKNSEIVNFVTVGVINPKRKNSSTMIDAVKKLHERGINNFKVTVIGKGKLNDISPDIRHYFDIKGRLDFTRMYEELEKADFMLTAYDIELHQRYNTVGTSGNFQLVYGFGKPCLIIKDFAALNGFTDSNSILYDSAADYADAMQRAIEISADEYEKMQKDIFEYASGLYDSSKQNLSAAINREMD